MRSRKELLEVFKKGQTVIYNGVHYMSPSELPSEAEMAKGNKTAEAEAKQNLLMEQARIQAQLAILSDSDESSKSESKGSEETESGSKTDGEASKASGSAKGK